MRKAVVTVEPVFDRYSYVVNVGRSENRWWVSFTTEEEALRAGREQAVREGYELEPPDTRPAGGWWTVAIVLAVYAGIVWLWCVF